ncbi:MAG: phosphate ABC transporter permease subunit PstC [Alphaproteobacteria bacterium]|nr:phosphate ABC transporter permease subunit PstC [Alphaproteobacteria bacterium]
MTQRTQSLTNWTVRGLTALSGLCVVVFTIAFAILLGYAAWPAFSSFGLHFLTNEAWNPVTDSFGALSSIYGTIISAAIALVLSFPVSIGIGFCLSEIMPRRLVLPIRSLIELLAGIPSLVYGLWGMYVLAPCFQTTLQPFLIKHLGHFAFIGQIFSGPPYGVGLLTAGIVLAIMILPFLTAIVVDLFQSVPRLMKESAYALGMTPWEVTRSISLPYIKQEIFSGAFLALGRALGETMAVTFVVGNAHRISTSLLAPATTISASIANEFNEATSDMHTSSLIALGFILLVSTFLALVISKCMAARAVKGRPA